MRKLSFNGKSARYMLLSIVIISFVLKCKLYADERTQISNIRFETVDEKVIIYYDLNGPRDLEYQIKIILKRDSQKSFAYSPKLLTGDVGRGLFVGRSRKVVWDVKKEFAAGLEGSDYYFVVNAEPVGRGGNMVPWLGVGAVMLGGGVAAILLLSKDHDQPPPASGFPGPPGRPR